MAISKECLNKKRSNSGRRNRQTHRQTDRQKERKNERMKEEKRKKRKAKRKERVKKNRGGSDIYMFGNDTTHINPKLAREQ